MLASEAAKAAEAPYEDVAKGGDGGGCGGVVGLGPHNNARAAGPCLVLVHVAEYFLHGCVADRPVEVDKLDSSGRDVPQEGQEEQQPAKARRITRLLAPCVLAQHHLRLVLQVLDLARVLQTPSLCKHWLLGSFLATRASPDSPSPDLSFARL
jgi:hypothetical protein